MKDRIGKGLSPEEIVLSREEHGENVITPPKKESVWLLFFEKFNDPIIKILIIAAFLSLAVAFIDGHFAETIGIFVAILLATGVSFWFEYDAMKRFEILNTVNDDTPVKVVREECVCEIPKRDVVVGDVVVLTSGDEIPADGELHKATSMNVNESTLTGEPMIKKTIDVAKFSKVSTYPSNMVLRGTTVVEGHGVMVVTAVGDSTEFGKVAEQATAVSGEKTPLSKQLTKLSSIIGKVGAALSALIFVILVLKGLFFGGELLSGDWLSLSKEILGYFMVSVAIIVMAIPEGLPMSITLSLAMNMRRMLKTNNLVRKMHACETMGAVTVICTDKTGTLTCNEMRVWEVKRYTEVSDELFYELLATNSTAFLDQKNKVIGNPTEGALLLWMYDQGANYSEIRNSVTVVDQLTFTTERKYMATLVESQATGKRMLYVKGAPEIVMGMCAKSGIEEDVRAKLLDYQNKAMRTLGFAMVESSASDCKEAIAAAGLSFIGITAISDPVREDVAEAVGRCMNAGIDIKIITGDTPNTAREIARQIGLWDNAVDGEINHITGVEFEAMSDEELLERVDGLKIMSRARPLDKQRLVRLLQKRGEVVAVTGDGTNDAPALNFANVGLSMGSGTSVARQASDITLLDDSFSSIATAVMWGRSLYKNIQRFVMFQLTVNFAALVVVFFGSIFGKELPLTVTQILWVNLIMDTFAAIALASLPADPKVMDEKPRRENDFIISGEMLRWIVGIGIVVVAVLMSLLFYWGEGITIYQLSIFFSVFVMMQFWNLFNARTFGSKYPSSNRLIDCKLFLWILVAILAGQILIVTFWGDVFRTVPILLKDWLLIIGLTSLVAIGGGVYRFIFKR